MNESERLRQCVAVCCSALQCVAMCCSVMHCHGSPMKVSQREGERFALGVNTERDRRKQNEVEGDRRR